MEAGAMPLRLLETERAPRLRGAHADLWRTASGWIWVGYFSVIAATLVAWAL